MEVAIDKDSTLCISVAARPTNYGMRFHNYLYQKLDLNFVYKAFSSDSIEDVITGVRALNIRGCSVSMPFKERVIACVDELDESAQAITSVNTVVNTNGYLKAYNTDYIAIVKLLGQYQVPNTMTFAVKGSGGMAKAVVYGLSKLGFTKGYIISRNQESGAALAESTGFTWKKEMTGIDAQLLINATPLGMQGGDTEGQLCFSEQNIQAASVMFDVVSKPLVTPAMAYAASLDKTVISGSEVFAIQAVEQFKLYTGVTISETLFNQARDYSRSIG